jgi:hypothetical protein
MPRESIVNLFKSVGIEREKSNSITEGCIDVEINFQLSPKDYIKFAEQDLETSDNRGIINAISNAKRAIDCRTDIIIKTLGLLPDKLKIGRFEILQQLGVVAPRIIHKIRKIRNMMEHEYSLPEKEQAEDAVDVAILFETSSERVFQLFPETLDIYNSDYKEGKNGRLFSESVQIFFEDKSLSIISIIDSKRTKSCIKINSTSPLYFPLIRVYITTHLDKQKKQVLKEFYDALEYVA